MLKIKDHAAIFSWKLKEKYTTPPQVASTPTYLRRRSSATEALQLNR